MEINQRNKKSTITVKGKLPFSYVDIKYEISALPDDWDSLIYDYFNEPTDIEKPILKYLKTMFDRVQIHIHSVLPRGKHSISWEFTKKMKVHAAYILCFVEYWLKKKEKSWPKIIKDIIREYKDTIESESHSGKKLRIKSYRVTACIMEKKYGRERKKYNLQSEPWSDDPDNFKRIYIVKNPFIQTYKTEEKEFEKGKLCLPRNLPITLEDLSKGSDLILNIT